MTTTSPAFEATVLLPGRHDPRWRLEAACACHPDPDIFFASPKSPDRRKALALCTQCPVRDACLEDAIECGIRFGIRGGRTEDQLTEIIKHWGDRQIDIDRVRATLASTTRPNLTEREKGAVVRVALDADIPIATWSEALGIGYKAAAKRRSRAATQMEIMPRSMRADEIALAAELRRSAAATPSVAA